MPETIFTGPLSAGVGSSAARAKGWSASFSALRGSRSNTPALYACTSSRMPRNAAASGVPDSAREGSRETRRRFARCSFCCLRSLGWRCAACMRSPLAHRVSPALASISVRSEAASPSSSARTVAAGGPMVAPVDFVIGGITAGPRERRPRSRWRLERARCRSRIEPPRHIAEVAQTGAAVPETAPAGPPHIPVQSRRAVTAHHRARPGRSHAADPRRPHRRPARRAGGL